MTTKAGIFITNLLLKRTFCIIKLNYFFKNLFNVSVIKMSLQMFKTCKCLSSVQLLMFKLRQFKMFRYGEATSSSGH